MAALEVFRVAGDREFPIQLLLCFLHVAGHDGCRQHDLVAATGMSNASVSRCLDRLSDTDRHGNPGLRLIVRKVDQDDYKQYRLFMTPRGQSVADLMARTLTLGEES